jgi:hypothetical protein
LGGRKPNKKLITLKEKQSMQDPLRGRKSKQERKEKKEKGKKKRRSEDTERKKELENSKVKGGT